MCPAWIDPFITTAMDSGARNKAYLEALKGTRLRNTVSGSIGKIGYHWLGRHGWPVTFQVEIPGVITKPDWPIETVLCVDGLPHIYPRLPTAEETYELLRRG